jgi:hypothetical protein
MRTLQADPKDKIWMIFAFADDGKPDSVPMEEDARDAYRIPPPVLAFRLHVGELTATVQRQVRDSMLRQCKTMEIVPNRITAYAAPLDFTTNGHQRWIGRDRHETLYPEQW